MGRFVSSSGEGTAAEGAFERVYAGEGPVYSQAVEAWLFVVNEGRSLAIADDDERAQWWMTPEEVERAEKERERAEKDEARVHRRARGAARGLEAGLALFPRRALSCDAMSRQRAAA